MSKPKLHVHPLSTFARRVQIALIEKDLLPRFEFVTIDMAKGEHRKPPFTTELNPYGRVPVLEDGHFVLYESSAILEYIEAKFPEPALVPASLEERALVAMHVKLCDIEFTRHVTTMIFPKRFLPKERWRADALTDAKKGIEKHFAILEKQLAAKSYLVAERFTLADLCYIPFLDFLHLLEVEAPPNVAAWRERLLARPSAQATKMPM